MAKATAGIDMLVARHNLKCYMEKIEQTKSVQYPWCSLDSARESMYASVDVMTQRMQSLSALGRPLFAAFHYWQCARCEFWC